MKKLKDLRTEDVELIEGRFSSMTTARIKSVHKIIKTGLLKDGQDEFKIGKLTYKFSPFRCECGKQIYFSVLENNGTYVDVQNGSITLKQCNA